MQQLNKVYLVPTDKPTNLYEIGGQLYYSPVCTQHEAGMGRELHWTSDEEIKDKDYCLNNLMGVLKGDPTLLSIDEVNEHFLFHIGGIKGKEGFVIRKITATTNKELWYMKVSGSEFLVSKDHIKIPKIPQSFIDTYYCSYNTGTPITEVVLEEKAFCPSCAGLGGGIRNCAHFDTCGGWHMELVLNSLGEVEWRLKEEKVWTRELAKEVAKKAYNKGVDDSWHRNNFDEWFDKNYPK